ncbi:MAG TPA: hypothetical protein VN363_07030, partial [Anaerolineales bacterium]|nr:hypothetical protein [Anaerolineales bacterium]
ILTACLLALMPAAVILAQTGIVIDGAFEDWAGMPGIVDPGGEDDETELSDADITEFRAYGDLSAFYMLNAWDDTAFNPSGTGAGATIRAADGTYYRIYTTVQGNPATVPLSSLMIYSCTDASCADQTAVCTGAACTGAQAGSDVDWVDPFTGRPTPDCNGTACGTQDAAVEFSIPWTLIGGMPADGQTIFVQFGSYPTAPSPAPKDNTGANGVTCRNTGGVIECYVSDPTAITLSSLQATAASDTPGLLAGGLVLAVLLVAMLYEKKLNLQVG